MDRFNNNPQMNSSSFLETKKAIQKYASLIIDIKSKFSPHQKNSEEYSLKFYGKGLTTTPIPISIDGNIKILELNLDLIEHKLEILFGRETHFIELNKSNIGSFAEELQDRLNILSIPNKLNNKVLEDSSEIIYNNVDSELLWDLISNIYFTILEFKSPILKETSSINFWPHHFDIAMLLFSGKLIPEQDIKNWSYSREQTNFGFLLGDEYISKPYFYVTLYPFEESLIEHKLNFGSYWYTDKWNGAILELDDLLQNTTPVKTIISFFEEVRNLAPKQFYKD